ncbi:NADPH-dependent codeinone reductase 1-3 isoform X3 [Jatropha curcas]|uniref:NADPH-dependent codeinone reductase 1-3 isoform X3 n=1 Tax=Jatropha curcas TaxID=180498 RepID=UPI0009D6B206|nr:NADPH-dependent codeinone reductase 1-3 isoform X3 [Jatropha curcas]
MSLISKTKEEKRTQNFLLRKKKMDINSRITIPEVLLSSSSPRMKLLGMGTATFPRVPSKETKEAILEAIKIGYRHFDTASLYQTEEPLGQAIAEALSIGLIKSRKELFITSKLWSSDAHSHLFLTALQKSLWALQLDYIDLYLIHLPVSCKPGIYEFPVQREDFLPMDFKGVWTAMEECQKLGFTKSIGVSNFSCKKLSDILAIAEIPPAVKQVSLLFFFSSEYFLFLVSGKAVGMVKSCRSRRNHLG